MADNEEIVKALEEKKYDYDNIVELFKAYNKASN
jgi:c-di-GMP-related signal transduction protein